MPIFLGPADWHHARVSRYSTPGLGHKEPLANGEQGTAQTIAVMRKLVDQALEDQHFIRKAIDIVVGAGVPQFDDLGEVHALYDWVKRNIRYTKDPTTKEKLYPPAELLKIRAGDCDDISMLLAALSMSLGYPARFITISTAQEDPAEFTHVYIEAEVPAGSQNWIALDAARIDSEFGVEPPIYFRKRAWNVASDTYEDLSGNLRRMPKNLNGYLGQDGSIDWTPIVQQSVAEIPSIIAATSGKGTTSSPYGTYSSNPYSSFQTPYTPGYGIPAAGYGGYQTGLTVGASSSSLPMLILVGLALVMFMKR